MDGIEEMRKVLEDYKQGHLLKYWHELTEAQQKSYLAQLQSIDFKALFRLWQKAHDDQDKLEYDIHDDDMRPCSVQVQVEKEFPHSAIEEYRELGLEEISNSRVAVIVLGGGQGTRLGMPYPKGMCPTGIPSGKTLYQLQAERILRLMEIAKEKTGRSGVIYWYIMTSDATHMLTEKFLQQNKFFGLNKDDVRLFKQRQLPCFDLEGKLLMEEKDEIATAPDGNGGVYWALQHKGVLAEMQKKGIKYIHTHSVDNILVKVADPVFIGKCVKDQADFALKVIKREDPNEALGIVVDLNGKVEVVEYSEVLPTTLELPSSTDQGFLFSTGNICIHFFTMDFLKRICYNHETDLKLHLAKKLVTQIGPEGDKMCPLTPNCVKMEKFIFDVVGYSKSLLLWEVERTNDFSPVKNSDVAKKHNFLTARQDLLALHKTWLENAGGKCQGVGVEISPLLSYDGEGLDKFRGKEFKEGQVLISEREEKSQDRRG